MSVRGCGRIGATIAILTLYEGMIGGPVLVAEQVPVVSNILALVERRDWVRLERFLAPDVHWTTGIEEQLHGATEVIAILKDDPVPGPPAFHEIDADGRLTRWIDKVG